MRGAAFVLGMVFHASWQGGFSALPLGAFFFVHCLEYLEQALDSEIFVPLFYGQGIKSMGEGQSGQGNVHPLGLSQGYAHILDEMLDVEAGIEVPGGDAPTQPVNADGGRRAGADDVDDLIEVHARLVA